MKLNTALLIIDPQNDFCDLPEPWRPADPLSGHRIASALPVAGAHADMLRLATLIRQAQGDLSSITLTLDSHHRVDIAHPPFWSLPDGTMPAPFTTVSAQQVREGQIKPRSPDAPARVLSYLDELEARGRYQLMVWPVHCQIGTWGHNVHAAVQAACDAWAETRLSTVRYVDKGHNPWTEHYSAMQAEVPDPEDPDTQLQQGLIAEFDQADLLLIAGQASSHCVKATTEHLLDHLPSRHLHKVVLLTDCMSPVGGFETQAREFLAAVQSRGARLATSVEVLESLSTRRSNAR